MDKILRCLIGLTLCFLLIPIAVSAEPYSYNLYGNEDLGSNINYATLNISDVTGTSATFTFDTSEYAKQHHYSLGNVGLNLNPALGAVTVNSVTPASSGPNFLSKIRSKNMHGFGSFNNVYYSGIRGLKGDVQSVQIQLSWTNEIQDWTKLLTENSRSTIAAAKIFNRRTGGTGFAGATAATPIPTPLLLLCSGLLGLLGIRRRLGG